MAKKPYKFRQARKDAKAAAKKAFPGKVKARRVDPKIKISAEDRLALKEAQDTAKRELGNKAYLSRAEYETQQRAAREAFREKMREEFGEYGGKKAEPAAAEKAQPKKTARKAVAKKAVAPKPAVKKAAFKPSKTFGQISKSVAEATKPTGKKKMTRAERSAANKAAWKNMSETERKNWSANKPGAAKPSAADKEVAKNTKKFGSTKPLRVVDTPVTKGGELEKKLKAEKAAAPKRPTLTQLKRQESKGLEEAKKRVAAKNKALADSAKGKTQTPQAVEARRKAAAKPEGKPAAASKGSRLLRKAKGAGKLGLVGALAAETYGLASGSTVDNVREIQRLENKLASLTGKRKSKAKVAIEGAVGELGQLANLSTLGIVGKNRRQRMDELNKLISKEQAKQAKAQAKDVSKWRYGPGGESLVPGTAAYKAGSKTRPTQAQVAANMGGAKGGTKGAATGGAGSTIKVTPGSSYTVKKGDTLSAIAKSAGVSLADLRAANKKFKTNPKYKQGSMIFSGTTVKIPKKK